MTTAIKSLSEMTTDELVKRDSEVRNQLDKITPPKVSYADYDGKLMPVVRVMITERKLIRAELNRRRAATEEAKAEYIKAVKTR